MVHCWCEVDQECVGAIRPVRCKGWSHRAAWFAWIYGVIASDYCRDWCWSGRCAAVGSYSTFVFFASWNSRGPSAAASVQQLSVWSVAWDCSWAVPVRSGWTRHGAVDWAFGSTSFCLTPMRLRWQSRGGQAFPSPWLTSGHHPAIRIIVYVCSLKGHHCLNGDNTSLGRLDFLPVAGSAQRLLNRSWWRWQGSVCLAWIKRTFHSNINVFFLPMKSLVEELQSNKELINWSIVASSLQTPSRRFNGPMELHQ